MAASTVALRTGWTTTADRGPGGAGSLQDEADDRPATIEELRAAANAALVATDDAIRSSQQELGLARSETGEDVVEPFTAALDQAQGELDRAFATARQAQDGADTDAERALLEEILTRCAAAGAHLDALAPRFDELRDLDGRVGDVLAHLAGDLTTLKARLSDATDIVGTLRTQFPRATIAGVVDDLDQASERLAVRPGLDHHRGGAARVVRPAGRSGPSASGRGGPRPVQHVAGLGGPVPARSWPGPRRR